MGREGLRGGGASDDSRHYITVQMDATLFSLMMSSDFCCSAHISCSLTFTRNPVLLATTTTLLP